MTAVPARFTARAQWRDACNSGCASLYVENDMTMQTRHWALWPALCLAAVSVLACSARADAQWRRDGAVRRPPPPIYDRGRTYDPAYTQGFEDGYKEGRDDARDGNRADARRHSRYRSADHGYKGRYGSRAAYKQVYRNGFSSGYLRGYRENLRDRRDRRDRPHPRPSGWHWWPQ
jgi:hypothetical protein